MSKNNPAENYAARRAQTIAAAEEALSRVRGATGATLIIPRPDGGLETVYLRKRKKRRPSRRS